MGVNRKSKTSNYQENRLIHITLLEQVSLPGSFHSTHQLKLVRYYFSVDLGPSDVRIFEHFYFRR